MRAMILAAGRGERMRPLTDHTPKPLLKVCGKSLIERTITQLVQAGFDELVINHAYLGQQIEDALGDGATLGATIRYSPEGDTGLETAGGIIHALPLLGTDPFLVVNGDIVTMFPYYTLKTVSFNLAHLVLVPNPAHHPHGDFYLAPNKTLRSQGEPCFTFSGIGVYDPQLFTSAPPDSTTLAPLLRQAMEHQQITGEYFEGFWLDVGTPQRLADLESYFPLSE